MDWTSIVITFISSGAFLSIFLITEKKANAAMKNMQLQSSEWEKLYREEKEDNDKKDERINTLNIEKEQLRNERDLALQEKNSSLIYSAKADILRCECLNCDQRKPPLDMTKIDSELLKEELRRENLIK